MADQFEVGCFSSHLTSSDVLTEQCGVQIPSLDDISDSVVM